MYAIGSAQSRLKAIMALSLCYLQMLALCK
jgi:hypothetical protein